MVELYGTHELGMIAWQCTKRGGFHVSDDSVIVEVLKDGRPARPGEVGEVVATRLHALAMPFIRYRLGDLVTQGDTPCPCGAPFSTILTVQGRMLDYFPLANGRLFHPYELVMIILDHGTRWIGQYQLTQERRDRVVLRVVPRLSPSPEDIAGLERAARETLGPGIEFQVVLVPEIPLEVTGKFRVSRSLVESAYDGIDWDRRRGMELWIRSGARPSHDGGFEIEAWDAVAAGQREPQFQEQIALYKRRENLDLVAAWAPAHARVALKTDLFEEAFGNDALLDALGHVQFPLNFLAKRAERLLGASGPADRRRRSRLRGPREAADPLPRRPLHRPAHRQAPVTAPRGRGSRAGMGAPGQGGDAVRASRAREAWCVREKPHDRVRFS